MFGVLLMVFVFCYPAHNTNILPHKSTPNTFPSKPTPNAFPPKPTPILPPTSTKPATRASDQFGAPLLKLTPQMDAPTNKPVKAGESRFCFFFANLFYFFIAPILWQ